MQSHRNARKFAQPAHQLSQGFSDPYLRRENVTGLTQRQRRRPPLPPPRSLTDTHQLQPAAQGFKKNNNKKNPLTQDSTLRMVCGCLANAMGSTADPVRPAPNDPTPSIFFSVCAPRSRLRGCMDALLFSAVGTGPCAHPQPRGHSARKRGRALDSHDRDAASEKLLFSRQRRSITVCVHE